MKEKKTYGPYSPSVTANGFIFCSGQIGIGRDIKVQARQAIENLETVLEEVGSGLDQVVKVEIYLADMDYFETMNRIYLEYFKKDPKPARTTVEVSRLPKDSLIEISCIAAKK